MTPERRAVVSIAAAALVLVAVTAVVLVFGVIPLPDFPSLTDAPDPAIPGTVAFTDFNEDPCIFIVPASGGEPQEAWCGRDYVEFPAWTPDGYLVVMDWTARPTYVLIDPLTGVEVDRLPADEQDGPEALPIPYPLDERRERADGATVRTEGRADGEAAVLVRAADGSQQTIVSVFDAPADYYFVEAQWSPDGEWVLVSDSVGRLMIVGAGGSPEARVLVDGLSEWGPQAAWYIPGNDTYTVDIPGR